MSTNLHRGGSRGDSLSHPEGGLRVFLMDPLGILWVGLFGHRSDNVHSPLKLRGWALIYEVTPL